MGGENKQQILTILAYTITGGYSSTQDMNIECTKNL